MKSGQEPNENLGLTIKLNGDPYFFYIAAHPIFNEIRWWQFGAPPGHLGVLRIGGRSIKPEKMTKVMRLGGAILELWLQRDSIEKQDHAITIKAAKQIFGPELIKHGIIPCARWTLTGLRVDFLCDDLRQKKGG